MDKQTLLNIGKNNFVVVSRILSITTFEAAAIKRFIQTAKENGLVLNSTCGRKTRSAILLDTGFVILSSVQPETLASRLKAKDALRTRCKKTVDIETDMDTNEDLYCDDDYKNKSSCKQKKLKNNISQEYKNDKIKGDNKEIGKKNV